MAGFGREWGMMGRDFVDAAICGRPESFGIEIVGLVAEWLGRALQKLLQQFESARDLAKASLRIDRPRTVYLFAQTLDWHGFRRIVIF